MNFILSLWIAYFWTSQDFDYFIQWYNVFFYMHYLLLGLWCIPSSWSTVVSFGFSVTLESKLRQLPTGGKFSWSGGPCLSCRAFNSTRLLSSTRLLFFKNGNLRLRHKAAATAHTGWDTLQWGSVLLWLLLALVELEGLTGLRLLWRPGHPCFLGVCSREEIVSFAFWSVLSFELDISCVSLSFTDVTCLVFWLLTVSSLIWVLRSVKTVLWQLSDDISERTSCVLRSSVSANPWMQHFSLSPTSSWAFEASCDLSSNSTNFSVSPATQSTTQKGKGTRDAEHRCDVAFFFSCALLLSILPCSPNKRSISIDFTSWLNRPWCPIRRLSVMIFGSWETGMTLEDDTSLLEEQWQLPWQQLWKCAMSFLLSWQQWWCCELHLEFFLP